MIAQRRRSWWGYGPYIELLGPTAKAKAATPFPIGAEEDRCRYAIERAAEGRRVALVCSGDAGIYAMASLVFEMLDRDGAGQGAGARAVEVVVGPRPDRRLRCRRANRRPTRT